MIDRTQLQDMSADDLRALALELMTEVQAKQHIVDRTEAALRFSDAKLAQLTHEMAVLKRWKFAARSEKLGHEQQSLLDESIDADLAAIELELERLSTEPKTKDAPNKPRRAPLPANLPRVNVHHEPESTVCGCGCELKRIGEDVSEKLDYTPGMFTVERHVRGKWVCAHCETLTQAPVPAFRRRACWLTCLFRNTAITFRCTDRNASSRVPAWPFPDRHWVNGWARVAFNCSP
jgi:hypothetical protein